MYSGDLNDFLDDECADEGYFDTYQLHRGTLASQWRADLYHLPLMFA